MGQSLLEVKNLYVSVEGKEILKGFSISIGVGEVHALMGRNGSGKSTLGYVLMGHPRYQITKGSVRFNGKDLLSMSPDERAREGLFLAFQYPVALPGITVNHFLREACRQKFGEEYTKQHFRKTVKEILSRMKIDQSIMTRYVHDGMSGGEKKRLEVLQLALLKPTLAILDETDSGLDVDALKIAAEAINVLKDGTRSYLIITHYQRMLDYIRPDIVHILVDGKVVRQGDYSLAEDLDRTGYEAVTTQG